MAENMLGRAITYLYSNFTKAGLSPQPAPKHIVSDIGGFNSQIDFSAFTEEELQRALTLISWVYADISLIARNIWSGQFEIKRPGESRKMITVPDHPFLDVYNKPNPWMTKSYLIEYLLSWLFTSRRGAFAYLAPNKDNLNELLEIWPINSNQIQPIRHGNFVNDFIYYPKESDKKPFRINGRNILWLRYADPFDYWASRPPFLAAIAPAQIEAGIANSQDKLYNDNRGLPLTLVSLDSDLSQPDFEAARAQIEQDWQKESSTIAVTRAGQIHIQSLGFTQAELQTILAQKTTRDQIDTIFFGYAIHSDQLTSGEGLKEMDKIIKEQVYYPLFVLLEDHIQTQIIDRFYAADGVKAKYRDPRTYDRALNIQESMIFSRWRSIDQMREADGDPPFEDPEGMKGYGRLPVPLATNSSFIAAYFGIGASTGERPEKKPEEVGNLSDFQDPEALTSQMARGDEPSPTNDISIKEATQEGIRTELKRFRKVAKRSFVKSGDALERKFETSILPTEVFDELTANLKKVATEQELMEIFEPWILTFSQE